MKRLFLFSFKFPICGFNPKISMKRLFLFSFKVPFCGFNQKISIKNITFIFV